MGSLITIIIIKIGLTIPEIQSIAADDRSHLFSEVLRSSRLGFNRIVFPRATADWVEENTNLSMIDKAHLERLRSEYTQLTGQERESQLVMRVVGGGDVEQSNDGRIISIGYERIIQNGYLLKSTLLLENGVNDGMLITIVLRHEAKKTAFGELSFEVANGGGSTTAGGLERLVSMGRVVACICDTDIKVPGGARSPTYNNVMSESAALPLVGLAIGTLESEAENFIPLSVLEKIFGAPHPGSCLFLRQIMAAQGDCVADDCFWLYFDVKLGIAAMMPHLNTIGKTE